jgi:hypothetical protein
MQGIGLFFVAIFLAIALFASSCVPVAVGLGVGAGAAVGAYEVNKHLPAKQ